MTRYIAIVAEKGAGKGLFVETVKRLLPNYKVESIRFSDPLRDILVVLDKPVSRENLQRLVTGLRMGFEEEGILNSALRKRFKNISADIVFLDGLRKPEEVNLVKELGGILIYITADPKLRFGRLKKRAENNDEKNMSWEQFERQENAPPEISIKTVGEKMSDFKIENNGTIEKFEKKIADFVDKIDI